MPLMDSFVMETSVAILARRMGGLLVETSEAILAQLRFVTETRLLPKASKAFLARHVGSLSVEACLVTEVPEATLARLMCSSVSEISGAILEGLLAQFIFATRAPEAILVRLMGSLVTET